MKKKRRNKIAFPKNTEETLSEIKKSVKIIAASIAIQQIEKIASTEDRKAMWVLCDGKSTREQIASRINVSKRAVSYFIEDGKVFGLIEEEKEKGGHPKRIIDYIPAGWKEFVKKQKRVKEEKVAPSAEAAEGG